MILPGPPPRGYANAEARRDGSRFQICVLGNQMIDRRIIDPKRVPSEKMIGKGSVEEIAPRGVAP
ncbi:MAG: hypothetical protein CL933_08545 [Deltaproteobacteria bacterium]|nr:hypothetical protein [Deltaproteobacteria bacterium]